MEEFEKQEVTTNAEKPVPSSALAHNPDLQSHALALPQGYATNLDVTHPQGKALLINASSPGELDFSDNNRDESGQRYIDTTVVAFVCFPDQRTDEQTGEMHEFTRTVLISPDGRMYRTTAAHGARKMRDLAAVFGQEDWAKGIPIRITERMGKRRTLYHDIRVGHFND